MTTMLKLDSEAYVTTTGSKYEETKHLDIAAVAQRVRADIAAAKAKGFFPKSLKTAVKIKRYSMGQSMTVTGSGIVQNGKTRAKLEAIMQQYVKATTQGVTDYSNVTFHTWVHWE